MNQSKGTWCFKCLSGQNKGGSICFIVYWVKRSVRIWKNSIFTDFNLNVCISYMNNLVKGYDLQKLYENIPKESETTKYRRKITSDMQNEAVFKAFDRYAKQVARAVSYEKKSTYSNLIYQKQKWHLDSLLIYIQAVEQLLDDLKRQSSYSDAMEELVSYLYEVTKVKHL